MFAHQEVVIRLNKIVGTESLSIDKARDLLNQEIMQILANLTDENIDEHIREYIYDCFQDYEVLDTTNNKNNIIYFFENNYGLKNMTSIAAAHWLKLVFSYAQDYLAQKLQEMGYCFADHPENINGLLTSPVEYPLVKLTVAKRPNYYCVTHHKDKIVSEDFIPEYWSDEAVAVPLYKELSAEETKVILGVSQTGICQCSLCGNLRYLTTQYGGEAPLIHFPFCYKPPTQRTTALEKIEFFIEAANQILDQDELVALINEHSAFLGTGGEGGYWQILSVDKLPLCVYQEAKGTEGKQLVLSQKQINPQVSLQGKDLRFADFSGCMAKNVIFDQANLEGSVAVDAILAGAQFKAANLKQVDFSGSNLRNCDFSGADLNEADFENADCTGCDFRNAQNLSSARFLGAVLKEIKR